MLEDQIPSGWTQEILGGSRQSSEWMRGSEGAIEIVDPVRGKGSGLRGRIRDERLPDIPAKP
ncbi:MAG: hypothetical protein CL694_01970 [Chloroflexi bacterium]|nr:hypothetical protein [Chloroflexota bacterium]